MAEKMYEIKVLHTRDNRFDTKYYRAGVTLSSAEQILTVTESQLASLEADRYVKVVSKTAAAVENGTEGSGTETKGKA